MPNAWIKAVKEFASKNNLKYNEALKSTKLKEEYRKSKNDEPKTKSPKKESPTKNKQDLEK